MTRFGVHDPSDVPRDTGMMLEGRLARERRRRQRQRRRIAAGTAAALLVVLAAGWLVWRGAPSPVEKTSTTEVRAIASAAEAPAVGTDSGEETAPPTPLFAAHKNVALHVPVPTDRLTEIAFHQASFSYATHLDTQLTTFPMESAKKKRGTGRTAEKSGATESGWLEGSVLRLWRDRPGQPDSAADVGAPAGTPVLAPVTGEVLLVKDYYLYSKYPDYQIHIRPDGHDDLDAVLIHVTSPTVKAGDRVVGGVTQVASVRDLASRMRLQLTEYVKDAGNHTHVQLNRVEPGTTDPVGTVVEASPSS